MVLNVTIPADSHVQKRQFKNSQNEDVIFYECRFIDGNTIYIARSGFEFHSGDIGYANIKQLKFVDGFKFVTFTFLFQ